MIKAVYDNESGKILLISSGEHQRVGDAFRHSGHLRDKWYHAPVAIEDVDTPALSHKGVKVMDITEDWRDVVKLFTDEGARTLVDEIIEAANEFLLMHPIANPPADGDAVSGSITFSAPVPVPAQ